VLYDPFQPLTDELIQAFPFLLGLGIQFPVQVGRKTHHEASRERFVWFLSTLGAEIQVIIDGLAEGLLELIHALGLKGDDIAGIQDFPVKYSSLRIQFNVCCITFVLQHTCSLPLRLNTGSDEEAPHGLERSLVGLFPRMRTMKDGANAVEVNANT
jgi:hypothetical protein